MILFPYTFFTERYPELYKILRGLNLDGSTGLTMLYRLVEIKLFLEILDKIANP